MNPGAVPLWAWALVVVCALAVGVATAPVLRALPVPSGEPSHLYATLATSGRGLAVAILSACAGTVAVLTHPELPWLFVPTSTIAVVACVIDARTMYLPLRLCQAGWAAGVASVAASIPVLGADALARAVVGSVVGGLIGWLGWRWLGFGFGDARLLMLTVGLSSAVSTHLAVAGMVAGTILGGVSGMVVTIRRGRESAFAYGPSLVAGLYVGMIWSALSG